MYRDRAADVAEAHVEGVSLAVGVERLLVEAIDPRAHEGNAGLVRIGLECGHVRVWPAEDVVALYRHAERDVADRGRDRHARVGARIGQLNDVALAPRGVALRGRGERGEAHQECEADELEALHRADST